MPSKIGWRPNNRCSIKVCSRTLVGGLRRCFSMVDQVKESRNDMQAKYVTIIELVETLSGIAGGKGGYWEDDQGYEWYVGI